ncbi:MAG TPA: sigma-70 family RNA polymerase sigma factor, partial [Kofleriaceae bacterium]|nr:sigma-70 family RNA polymerase sigma factor [Kofleriaceae bacterium]
ARVANRDEAAFNTLYTTYLPLVLRWTLRETRDRELAADLSAEVFAAAMLAAPRYRADGGSVAAWLVGIAANKLRESRRRKRVEDSARRRLKLEPVVLTDADLELVDELVGMDDRLQALIQSLPAEQQQAVMARVVGERSYEEIAAEMECSPSVVRQRVSRGLRSLRSELEGS